MDAEFTLHVDGRHRSLTLDTRTTLLARAFLEQDGFQCGYCAAAAPT